MIGDLCNPLNPGEQNTVRITMLVSEARELIALLDTYRAKPRHVRYVPSDDGYTALRRILARCLEREDNPKKFEPATSR